MEVGRGLVYPCQTMLVDVQIDASSYAVVKVDMVHENSKDLKLKVAPTDTMLTMRDAVTRRVQWRQTSIDVDPSTAASALTNPSQPNISPASIFPEPRLSPSPNSEHLCLSPIREQLRPSPIREQLRRSAIRDQPCRSPAQTRSTPLPTPDQTQPKTTKNVRGKSLPQLRKMSSKGNKPFKESVANPKLPSAMTQANPKIVMGKPKFTVDALHKVGQPCVELHN
jgi:hypothetical protein